MTYEVTCRLARETVLVCHVIPMGEDLSLTVYGGEKPHVGAVVMAVARPSLTGEGISASTSVLCRTGHKDDLVARKFAEAAAIHQNCVCACACGIHMDGLTGEELEIVGKAADELLQLVINGFEMGEQ